jgi:hypothetical protein
VLLDLMLESKEEICATLRDYFFCLAQKLLPFKVFCRLFSEALYGRRTLVIMSPAKNVILEVLREYVRSRHFSFGLF